MGASQSSHAVFVSGETPSDVAVKSSHDSLDAVDTKSAAELETPPDRKRGIKLECEPTKINKDTMVNGQGSMHTVAFRLLTRFFPLKYVFRIAANFVGIDFFDVTVGVILEFLFSFGISFTSCLIHTKSVLFFPARIQHVGRLCFPGEGIAAIAPTHLERSVISAETAVVARAL